MAEVSLTFENTRNLLPTDFTTVTITRKFYKSGESEYRLNDVSCRLKDIHNLFLDTGVSNDSYAIIELGMVDDIIKDKENSRRRMLEQAAGISIYKTRKKEAKQKLEGTEQDLSRIEDLLFEIGNNLRTLENQAKKAERFFQIKGEYKKVSVELAKASLEHFNDQYKGLNEQMNSETDRRTALEAIVATSEASVESDKVKLISREQELSLLQKQFNELLNRIRQLEGEKKLAAQRLEHLKDREKNLKDFLGGAGTQLQQLEELISHSSSLLEKETEELENLREQLQDLRDSVDDKREEFDIRKQVVEALRNEYSQKQRGQFESEKKVAIADSAVQNLKRSIHQVQEEINTRNIQLQNLATEKESGKNALSEKQEILQDLVARQEAVKGKILNSQEQLEGLRANLVEENRKLDARRNEHDLLKSLVDNLEGYPESIKFLKKNKDWNSNAPLLSDVFVVEPEYKIALENLLDNYLNYYLVSDVQDAVQAIHLLEENKKGKANFFVLSNMKDLAENSFTTIAGLKPALAVITVEPRYQSLAAQLLGHVYIADSETEFSNIKLGEGQVVIEKSGRMRRGIFTVSGGSIGLFEGNKIGRAKNLEKLAGDIAKLSTSAGSLKDKIAGTQQQLTGFNQELNGQQIEQSRQQINTLQNKLINLENQSENHQQLNDNGSKKLEDLQEQLQHTQDDVSDSRITLEEINAQMSAIEEKGKEAQKAFSVVEQEYNFSTQQYNNQNIALTRQQSKIEGLKQELGFRNKSIADLKNQMSSNEDQLRNTTLQLTETEGKLHGGDNELYELLTKKDKDEAVLNEKDRAFYEFRNTVMATETILNQKRREKEHAEALLNGIKDKLNEMKLQLAGMKERLSVEFKVNLDDILDEDREGEEDVEVLKAEAERMKKRLENMGEVNPTAIEAFTEMSARFDFITEQKTDLVDAKNSLLATIEEVERTANSRFKETFDAVRENFKTVFKALFTEEDAADLRLTDPDNIADSGIEIFAQPKGKKPSTLAQLSGGEKTLTSTAYLFAIYLIKPAPFCILDEVDAPLDDANVGKFTNMIRKFSDNSQFIIVTHNKQTMAAVDVIYGVTMQEPGVSKLVPVDFRSLN